MCTVLAVDSKGSAGAPATEIEITPEMEWVGSEVIRDADPRFDTPSDIAKAVYLAMVKVAQSACPREDI
jgi:hypothetical protein